MKAIALLLALGLVGCSVDPPPPAERLCVPALGILTPAPPLETPLQKWKRTKADWERVSKIEDEARNQLSQQTMPVLMAYLDAEKELQTIQCGKVCVPEKTQ